MVKEDYKEDFKDQYCIFPFENVEINFDGKLYFCCSTWQKKPFGDFVSNSILEEWNSTSAQEIRGSIIDGSYRYCNKDLCPYLQSKNLKKYSELTDDQKKYFDHKMLNVEQLPKQLMLNYDRSCNLTCESCRMEKISYSVGSKEFETLQKLTDRFTSDFFSHSTDREIQLNITGSGDPFASAVFRQFLENLNGRDYPNLTIDLQTNGVLFTSIMWERIHKIHKNIGQVVVSVDAAKEETYLNVRRGGNWKQLLSNIEFLRNLRREEKIGHFQVNMVVQKRNYAEMVEFAELFNLPGIDSIYFSLIADWDTWNKEIFNQQAIWMNEHPEFEKFMSVLTDPIFSLDNVNLGNLTSYRESALASAYNKLSFWQKKKLNASTTFKKYFTKIINLGILTKKILSREKKLFKSPKI